MDTKECRDCGETKPSTDFYLKAGRWLSSYCKPCHNTRNRQNRKKSGKAYTATPEKRREWKNRHRYGIEPADYARMLAEQNGKCAICGSDDPKGHGDHFSIDHCHETGIVRGLLCTPCNRGIGYLQDDPGVVEAAASYLRGS